jgi:multicomponent Na+:H+ antiporter subunit F
MSDVWWWLAAAEVLTTVPLFVCLARVSTVSERVVALNAIATQATLAMFAVAAATARTVSLDVTLWMASFSYLGTLVWARYLERDLL